MPDETVRLVARVAELETEVARLRAARPETAGLGAGSQPTAGGIAAQDALAASESRFRSFADASPDVIYIVDAKSKRLEYLSPSYERVWGEPRDAIMADLGRWDDRLHPDDRARASATQRGVYEAREAVATEYRIVRADGRICHILDTAMPIGDPASGEVVRVAGIARDITDRRRQEDEYRSLATAVAQSSDFIGVADLDGRLTYLNPAGRRMIGFAEDGDIASLHFTDYVAPESQALFRDVVIPTARSQGLWAGEMRLLNMRTGVRIDVQRTAFSLRDADGRLTGYATVTRDVTAAKAAQEALSESEARFRAMADNIPQLAWMARPDGWLFWYNKRWYEYTGTSLEQMQGWGWQAVHDPAHVERVAAGFRAALISGEPWEDTFQLRGADGQYRWFLSRAMPVRGPGGDIELWFGTNTDITDRMRAELHHQLLVNELNHRVKNTLAIVQAMASQTLRTRAEAGAWEDYQNRLLALSFAHDLLTRENWEAAELGDVARQALRPYMTGTQALRIAIGGPSVRLDPKSALSLTMGFHELATNAAKYGALSSPEGRVAVSWTAGDGHVAIVWRESGGPPVTAPQRRGFGTRLIERGLAHELGGAVRLTYAPDGVICEIDIPRPAAADMEKT